MKYGMIGHRFGRTRGQDKFRPCASNMFSPCVYLVVSEPYTQHLSIQWFFPTDGKFTKRGCLVSKESVPAASSFSRK